jgi:hypothetical protein
MKPTSIIFLILSIILIATGVGLCFVAENMSSEQNIQLYSESIDENDNNVERYDLTNADLSRISLKLSKVNVNIINNADESYIELVNFSKNTYEFVLNLKTVSIDDTINIMSLLNFAESGFKFEGLRYFLTPDMYKDKPKEVNIYINDLNSLKVIDIDIDEGNLIIKDVVSRIDYTLNVNKGNVDLIKSRSSSVFSLKVGEGDVKLVETIITKCDIDIEKGDLNMYISNYTLQSYNLTAALGNITYGIESKGGTFLQELPIAATKTTAYIGTGDINIRMGE